MTMEFFLINRFSVVKKRTEDRRPMTEVSRYFASCFSWRTLKKTYNFGFSQIIYQ